MAGRGRGAVTPAWMTQGGTAAPGALQPAKTESIGQWTEHTAPDGRKYYYNSVLKKSSWAKPGGLAEAPASADSAWEEHTAPDGRKYYHNKVTKESKWTLPPGVKPIAVSKLAGGPGQYLCPPGAIQMGPTPVYATSGEAKEAFRAILRDAQIPSWMGWEQAVAVISADRRFGAVRTLGERRLLFDEYMMGRKKEEEAQASERNKQYEESFFIMLDSCTSFASVNDPRFEEADVFLAGDSRWSALDVKEKEVLFDKWIDRKFEEMERADEQHRAEWRGKLQEYLEGCSWIALDTTWARLQSRLSGVDEFQKLDELDCVQVFDQFMMALQDKISQDRENQEETRKKVETRNRVALRKIFDQQLRDGVIYAKQHWKEYLNTVGRNDAIISVEQNLGGSRPKELFLDTVEKAEATYYQDKPVIEEILNAHPIQISAHGPSEADFVTHIRTSDLNLSKDIAKSSLITFILEAKSKHEVEDKRRKDRFVDLLYKLEIPMGTSFEEIQSTCKDELEWNGLGLNESEKSELIEEYMSALAKKKMKDTSKRDRERSRRDRKRGHRYSDDEYSPHRYDSDEKRKSRRKGRGSRRRRSASRRAQSPDDIEEGEVQ